MQHILVIEDDQVLADLVVGYLAGQGYRVTHAARGDTGLTQLKATQPDLVLLDLMLPGLSGLEVCERARAAGYTGHIMMLTALADVTDEITGLTTGADDYLRKPIRPRHLLVRVQAMLRRHTRSEEVLNLGPLEVHPITRKLRIRGHDVPLTTADFDVLMVFARAPGRVLSRDDLSERLRGMPWDGQDRFVDVRVSRLRRKLAPHDADLITSVRGTGYLLAVP